MWSSAEGVFAWRGGAGVGIVCFFGVSELGVLS